jgi:nicotinamidase-related amidase
MASGGFMAERLEADDTALLIIDMQERLGPVMSNGDELVKRVATVSRGAHALGLPVLMTEQYPKGLGKTIPEIADAAQVEPLEKIEFSAVAAPGFQQALLAAGKRTVLIAGIETHVCVLQTCLDMLDHHIRPVLLADCTSSRHPIDRDTAIERLRKSGVVVTTLESALFELLVKAGTEQFKSISRLVKDL